MRKFYLIALCLAVTACGGVDKSEKVSAVMKKSDKYMTCNEVKLEMNEADFYKKTAERNKGPGIKTLLMPLGYVSTYLSAEDAIEASNSRADYLQSIYEIMDCERRNNPEQRQTITGPSGYYTPENQNYAPVVPNNGYNMPVSQPYPNYNYRPSSAQSNFTIDRAYYKEPL